MFLFMVVLKGAILLMIGELCRMYDGCIMIRLDGWKSWRAHRMPSLVVDAILSVVVDGRARNSCRSGSGAAML